MNIEVPVWAEPLFASIQARSRPEDVRNLVLEYFPNPPCEKKWRKRAGGISYMPSDFVRPSPLTKSANVLAYLIGKPPLSDARSKGVEIEALLTEARRLIGAPATGTLSFRDGRLDRVGRSVAGLDISRRRYNKLFRLVQFLETELEGNRRFGEICDISVAAKTGILTQLSFEEFSRDAATAIFVTYMAARMGLRSTFTVGPQDRPFDDLGEALLKELTESESTNWYAVAHVFSRNDILVRLSEPQRLTLVSRAIDQMLRAAHVLKRLAKDGNIDIRRGCVVQPGQDSSSWNAAAGAWNKSRDTWLGLAYTLRLDVDEMLPGKVPRLMAADVAAWHHSLGEKAHPDELIAAELPMPWTVLLEGVDCPASEVRATCQRHGVVPEKTGWSMSHERTAVEIWHPTPELVHGVTVDDPFTAAVMRRLGWFSGPAKYERGNFAQK